MSKALVHIGAHKAGSTYIQNLIRINHETLLTSKIHPIRGVTPDRKSDSVFEIHLKREIRKFRRAQTSKERGINYTPRNLHDVLSKLYFNSCIISCESIENLSFHEKAFNAFDQKLISKFNCVTYLYIIRNLIKSKSAEAQEAAKSLRLTGYNNIDRRLSMFSLDKQLNGFTLGDKKLTIYSFENTIISQKQYFLRNLINDYFQTNIEDFNDVTASNISVGAEGVAVLLCLRFLMIDIFGLKLTESIINDCNFLQCRKMIAQNLRNKIPNKSIFIPFTEEMQINNINKIRDNSKHIISHYGGNWMEYAFTNNVVPRSIVFLHELGADKQSSMLEIVRSNFEIILKFSIDYKFIESTVTSDDSIYKFLDNEKIIVGQ